MREAFERIYAKEAWGKGKGSGTGSSPVYCAAYLTYLRALLPKYDSVLDLGCGDWQLYQGFEWPKRLTYIGVDVVQRNIDCNELIHPGKFFRADFSDPEILRKLFRYFPAQLVLVKDVLQHWSDDEVARWLGAMKELPWRTIITVNNWRHFRSPHKDKLPRDVNNAYRWSPIDMRKYGFREVLYYPKGKFKQVCRMDNLEDIL